MTSPVMASTVTVASSKANSDAPGSRPRNVTCQTGGLASASILGFDRFRFEQYLPARHCYRLLFVHAAAAARRPGSQPA